ncbi:MAG: hypothetical protein D6715_09565 [Calditrichaeota bacterium]|nr:MAG: hypothetical protein D6715_09565 [Calditrichota bacterium]
MTYAVLICHGQLAQELASTAQGIVGPQEALFAFSNSRVDAAVLKGHVQELLDRLAPDRPVLLVDLWGGSCWRIGMQICHQNPGVELVSGVNLPMLVTFLSYRSKMGYAELVEKLIQDGRKSIRTSGLAAGK